MTVDKEKRGFAISEQGGRADHRIFHWPKTEKVASMTKQARGNIIVGVVCVAWVLSSLLGGIAFANGTYFIQLFTEPLLPSPPCEPSGTE